MREAKGRIMEIIGSRGAFFEGSNERHLMKVLRLIKRSVIHGMTVGWKATHHDVIFLAREKLGAPPFQALDAQILAH